MDRITIRQIKDWSNKEFVLHCIRERKARCTNMYSPLYERLSRLEKFVQKLSDDLQEDPITPFLADKSPSGRFSVESINRAIKNK